MPIRLRYRLLFKPGSAGQESDGDHRASNRPSGKVCISIWHAKLT